MSRQVVIASHHNSDNIANIGSSAVGVCNLGASMAQAWVIGAWVLIVEIRESKIRQDLQHKILHFGFARQKEG
jgi:hypothetical protein